MISRAVKKNIINESVFAAMERKHWIISLGANTYIQKPADFSRLAEVARQLKL